MLILKKTKTECPKKDDFWKQKKILRLKNCVQIPVTVSLLIVCHVYLQINFQLDYEQALIL